MAKASTKLPGAIIITGDKETNLALSLMPTTLQKKVIKKVQREIGKGIVIPAARRNLSAHSRTGALAASMKTKAVKRSRKQFGVAVNSVFKKSDKKFYGPFVELGTKYIRPVRYLRNALWANESQIRARFAALLKAGLRGAAITAREIAKAKNLPRGLRVGS